MDSHLSYPFYVYPGYPCSGYNDINTYKKNLLVLKEKIHQTTHIIESNNLPILFHLTMGACMEEYLLQEKTNTYVFQWQQLCPEHLRFHSKNGKKIIHFIVSPNVSFSLENFVVPNFVSQTNNEFNWDISYENNILTINSKTYEFTTYVFYTMMPTIDERNQRAIELIQLDEIVQTENDKTFVINFYDSLNFLFYIIKQKKGTVTCFSFAVFNEFSSNKVHNKYKMFKELLTQIEWNDPNMFLGEWLFVPGYYGIKKYTINTCNFFFVISYVESTNKFNDLDVIRIENDGQIILV